MEYRRLGRSGLQLSELSFGSWITFGNQIEDGTSGRLLDMAYDAGINFFDNAETYADGASEEVMGRLLAQRDWPRDTWWCPPKYLRCGRPAPPNAACTASTWSRPAMMRSSDCGWTTSTCTSAIDRTSRPPRKKRSGQRTSRSSRARSLLGHERMERRRDHGCPLHCRAPQPHRPGREQPGTTCLAPQGRSNSKTCTARWAWAPPSGAAGFGLLTGKYNRAAGADVRLKREELSWLADIVLNEKNLAKVERLGDLAGDLGTTLPKLALAWCLKNPDVSTVLLGASKPEQLEENLGAPAVVPLLTEDVMARIEEILDNAPAHP